MRARKNTKGKLTRGGNREQAEPVGFSASNPTLEGSKEAVPVCDAEVPLEEDGAESQGCSRAGSTLGRFFASNVAFRGSTSVGHVFGHADSFQRKSAVLPLACKPRNQSFVPDKGNSLAIFIGPAGEPV